MKFFNEIIAQWKFDWHNNQKLFWLELSGTLCNLTASALLGILAAAPPLTLILSLWIYGSISLAIASHIRKAAWWLFLMCFYTLMNIVGFINVLVN